jgi:peptidoglycan-associated lipoprotein
MPPPPPASPPSGPAVTEQNLPAPGSERDFVINVGDRVFFDYDKSDLRADAEPILEGQARWLSRYPEVQVRIEGNCDERGTQAYNLALGSRRAATVRDFLIAHGVYSTRITTISYGKMRPIDPGHDDAAWQRNRNAHTAILSGAG